MQRFWEFLRFVTAFTLLIGVALSMLWFTGGAKTLAALAISAFHLQ